eukprot:15430111-Alexandrium_andersonii.AAC.1
MHTVSARATSQLLCSVSSRPARGLRRRGGRGSGVVEREREALRLPSPMTLGRIPSSPKAMATKGCLGMTASGAWAKPHREQGSSTLAQCSEEA